MKNAPKLLSAVAFACFLPLLAASDKEIADSLAKDGVKVKFEGETAVSILFADKEMDHKDPTVEQFELCGRLKHLKTLTVYNKCPLTDATAGCLDELQELESAAINAMQLSDAGFAHLGRLRNLKKLTLWHVFNPKFDGSGSAQLAGLSALSEYTCAGSTFGDAGLAACAQLKQISALALGHTRITAAGLVALKDLDNLKSLTLSPQFSLRLSDAALEKIAGIPNLEKLDLGETLLTYDGGLKYLKDMKQLKEVIFKDVEIADADIEKLKADLPTAKITWSKPKPEQTAKLKAELAKTTH